LAKREHHASTPWQARLTAVRGLAHGYGYEYEVTGADVWSAWANSADAARVVGRELGFT